MATILTHVKIIIYQEICLVVGHCRSDSYQQNISKIMSNQNYNIIIIIMNIMHTQRFGGVVKNIQVKKQTSNIQCHFNNKQ